MTIVDGKRIAKKILEELKKLPKPPKKLAAVFVGENPASESFLKQKWKVAEELEIEFQLCQFPESISETDLKKEVEKIGADKKIGGLIIQLPLPPKFNRENILSAINPEKDIDALHSTAKVSPLAVEVVRDVLKEVGWNIEDKIIGVVGRGILVGEPIAKWLLGNCRELIIFHTKTDLSRIKECDLVISGVGKAGLIKPEMLKVGAGIIDFGFDMVGGKIRGDFDSNSLNAISYILYPSFYTPTPGGTGPVLVAELFKNFYKLSFSF